MSCSLQVNSSVVLNPNEAISVFFLNFSSGTFFDSSTDIDLPPELKAGDETKSSPAVVTCHLKDASKTRLYWTVSNLI
jgi:hypothetical protein